MYRQPRPLGHLDIQNGGTGRHFEYRDVPGYEVVESQNMNESSSTAHALINDLSTTIFYIVSEHLFPSIILQLIFINTCIH